MIAFQCPDMQLVRCCWHDHLLTCVTTSCLDPLGGQRVVLLPLLAEWSWLSCWHWSSCLEGLLTPLFWANALWRKGKDLHMQRPSRISSTPME